MVEGSQPPEQSPERSKLTTTEAIKNYVKQLSDKMPESSKYLAIALPTAVTIATGAMGNHKLAIAEGLITAASLFVAKHANDTLEQKNNS